MRVPDGPTYASAEAAASWRRSRLAAAAALVLTREHALAATLLTDELHRLDTYAVLLDTAALATEVLAGSTPRARTLRAYTDHLALQLPFRERRRHRLHRLSVTAMEMCAGAAVRVARLHVAPIGSPRSGTTTRRLPLPSRGCGLHRGGGRGRRPLRRTRHARSASPSRPVLETEALSGGGAAVSRRRHRAAVLEEPPRRVDEHRVDLRVGDARLPQRGEHVPADVQVVPVRHRRRRDLAGDPVEVARRVVAEHHPVGVPPPAQLGDHLDPLLRRQVAVDAEAVHAEDAAVGDQLLEVADVVGVAAVADDDAGQVDALGREDLLLLEAAA